MPSAHRRGFTSFYFHSECSELRAITNNVYAQSVKRVTYCVEIRMYARRIKIRSLKCNSRGQKNIHYIKDKITRAVTNRC